MGRFDGIDELDPRLDGAGVRIGIVVARFNPEIGEGLLSACVAALRKHGVQDSDVLIVTVPGALELPLALQKLAQELRVAEDRSSIEVGTTRTEIIRVARARKMDLIVVGAHERHALAFLFKRTEDAVLHRAPCDVLAIRMPRVEDSKKSVI